MSTICRLRPVVSFPKPKPRKVYVNLKTCYRPIFLLLSADGILEREVRQLKLLTGCKGM